MRLGAPIFGDISEPRVWAGRVRSKGYRAAYCPVDAKASDDVIREYRKAALEADIVIAEVGAWSNPLNSDDSVRLSAIEHNKEQLALADKIGARCCVNISGSRGQQWDGPYPLNLTDETFDLIVETVREILDAIKPSQTSYTLETMPWAYPDSPDSYLKLIKAVDRPGFAVHLDPVNIVSSPRIYYDNGAMIRECFAKLGPWIKSCHAKDILLSPRLTVHLDEVRPGQGNLNYDVFLREMSCIDPDTPIMLEHRTTEEDYDLAAEYIREVESNLHL